MRWLLVLLLVPSALASPHFSGLVADLSGPGDGQEGVAVSCTCNLSGWHITDGENTWMFPDGAQIAGEAWIVGNMAEWARFDGPTPHWEFDLRLGNDGDDLQLLDPEGSIVDAFSYGEKGGPSYTDANLIYRPGDGSWVTPRMHRVGESNIEPVDFDVDAVTAYASPDSSHEVLTTLLDEASERVHLHVYDLKEPTLVDALVAAGARGVDVQVMIEDKPVGADADDRRERAEALHRIQDAGGLAYLAGSERYAFHHLKVLVADDNVAIQTENWVASGVPPNPTTGNRGWGIVLHDANAADWFAHWMAEDRAAWDTIPFVLDDYDPWHEHPARMPARTGTYDPVPAQRFEGPISVTPYITPEHTADPFGELWQRLARDDGPLWIQQLDLRTDATNSLGWESVDPLMHVVQLRASFDDVRVMAAAPFHYTDTGNRDVLELMADVGADTAELDRPGLGTLHNKGMVGDDWVFMGSMNGNHHSRSNNREVSVWIDDADVAAYYQDLFLADWAGSGPRDWSAPLDDLQEIPAPLPTLIVGVLVAAILCSRSSPGLRSQSSS